MNARNARRIGLTLLVACGLLAGGCERIAPIRTLPSWVRGIYIPVFHNQSYEPAVEELATLLTQEAFLADGQLDVVQKRDADAMLRVSIVDWRVRARGTTGDRVTDRRQILIRAAVKLVEPYDENALIADLGEVQVLQPFNTDARSVRYDTEPDRKDEMLRLLAGRIVSRTLTGFPAVVTPLGQPAPTVASPHDLDSKDILRGTPSGMP